MKILSISSDRKVFEQGSAVRARLLEYGRLVDELHVIVFAKKSLELQDEKISSNIFLYSTNSFSKFFHISAAIFSAFRLRHRGVVVDLVTTQDPFEAGLAGYLVARIFGARLHLQIHTDVMSPYFAKESFLNHIRVAVAKFLIPRANAIRVVSERIKKSIQETVRSGVLISVLPIFAEYTYNKSFEVKKKYPQFNKTFLVVSRLSREKNIDMVIEAIRTVTKKFPATGLIIVGAGPELDHLKKLVKKYDLESNVVFEGWQTDLMSYYKNADALILASSYEGYGMVAVEALLAGCPVIMTDVGCAGDVVQDHVNGLVVPVGDTLALVSAVDRVASGSVKFEVKIPHLPTKEEYLTAYLKSWEAALL